MEAIVVALITVIGTVLVALIESVRRKVKPVSNGFASGVMRSLGEIQTALGNHDAKLDDLLDRMDKVEAKTDIWDRRKW